MPTKGNGPLMSDYRRAIKAAKAEGWKAVRVQFGDGVTVTLLADDPHLKDHAAKPKKEAKLNW